MVIYLSTKLHLGCGRTILPGWVNVDCMELPGVDVVADLDNCAKEALPFEDDSITEIFASHFLEHIHNPLPLFQELYRVACPDARAVFSLPYGSSDDAMEDPTHVRFYFLQSFGYFSQPYYWRADYGYRGDWKTMKIVLKVSKEKYYGKPFAEIIRDVSTLRNVVYEMIAELYAVKPPREPKRELQTPPAIHFEYI